ncbi:iron-sulfur cluster assembly accessory protein [Rhodopseudomonas sp. HC1]|uniref:HesB/IscA family protein n=1 Tax=Rhodopseudomonas infernalis TaxID=2897386 RepID=UPI001EE7BDCF|nr:iron-sulfur cluster assembly accessory protein [Rhodopseudomonas infernalis]MCG6204775.1 iron-sulfur cluster assembly accessory protein [Rhodopseudomonas infernalis]
MALIFTPSAEKFIRRMLRLSGGAGGFRLAVTSGGCSGLTAAFDVEAAPRSGDQVIDHGDLRLFVPDESCKLLEGVTIDFMETPTSSGFIFHDPKPSNCQCSGGTVEAPKQNLHQLQEL